MWATFCIRYPHWTTRPCRGLGPCVCPLGRSWVDTYLLTRRRVSIPHPIQHTGRMQVNQQQPHAPSASAIHWAATKGDLRALRWLVEYEGVDPSAKDTSSHHCETPLFRAAGANHPEVGT